MKRRNQLPSRNAILFNGAAILIGGASLIYALKSSLISTDAEQCSARYHQGTRMSFERGGAPLSADDLQSRLAGTDWGISERAKIIKTNSSSAPPLAMQIDMTGAKADDGKDDNGKEGVGFAWNPRSLGQVNAACLSYSIFLPEGFDFGSGGRLPGLMGQRIGANAEADTREQSPRVQGNDDGVFSARLAWRETGTGDIYALLAGSAEGRSLGNNRSGFYLTRGRWVQVEQEIDLNDAERKNGILRVWLDGSLRYEKQNVAFRDSDKGKITGVMAEFVPVGRDVPVTAKDQKILMSPFEVRWHKGQ